MYLDFFELKQRPFNSKSEIHSLYMNKQYMTAFSLLHYGIENCDGFIVISGEVGCGKTTLCSALINELDKSKYIILSLPIPPKNEKQLLESLCALLKITVNFDAITNEEIRLKIVEKLNKEHEKD